MKFTWEAPSLAQVVLALLVGAGVGLLLWGGSELLNVAVIADGAGREAAARSLLWRQ